MIIQNFTVLENYLLLVVFIIIWTIIIFQVAVTLEKRYWKTILDAQEIPLYWDAEPTCPRCGQVEEAAFGLNDDGEWHVVFCRKCDLSFWVKPKFELYHETALDKRS